MADWYLTDSQKNLIAVAVPSLPALGPWEPPAERGPSLESIYRVSLTVYFSTASWGPLKKKKNPGPWARAQCAYWLRRPCLIGQKVQQESMAVSATSRTRCSRLVHMQRKRMITEGVLELPTIFISP